MCGRLTLFSSPADIARAFDLPHTPTVRPSYNVAPTQAVGVIRLDRAKARRFGYVRWGLVPSWAKDASLGAKLINARAETLEEKPSFREAFRRRRCAVVSDGFYEWRREGRRKQPHFIHRADGAPMAFAGLWERWTHRGRPLDTCTIITTRPNALIEPLHDRMPVILSADALALWLDRDVPPSPALRELLRPCPDALLAHHPVTPKVGSVANDDAELVEPFTPRGQRPLFAG